MALARRAAPPDERAGRAGPGAALAELASKEAQETSAAQRDRDALRTQALDTIRDMDLAAKALEDNPLPRIELRALFDAR